MRRPTILFINRVYPPTRGATGRVLCDLARAFADEGWHVTVVTTGEMPAQERDGAVRIVRVKGAGKPANMLSYMLIWWRLFRAAMKLKPRHLVVTLSDPPLLIVAGDLIARFKKSKHVNWCHDLYPDVMPALGYNLPPFLMRFLTHLSRSAMERCEKIIVVGRCMAKYLALQGINPRKIAMIPNWPNMELVDVDNIENIPQRQYHVPMPEMRGARPYEEQIKEDLRFRVLYAGNMGLAHPVDTILQAAAILDQQGNDIEFLFVGEGSRFEDLAKKRAELGIGNIKFLPYQPEARLREVMESGDVHLISMREDAGNFIVPSKLYSALAAARPTILIGPEHSEVAKVIKDFEAGFVIPQGDAQNLAAKIAQLRGSGEVWFAAHHGAAQAGDVFRPQFSIDAWMERAWDIVKDDLL